MAILESPAKHWTFTWNNPTVSVTQWAQELKRHALIKCFAIQPKVEDDGTTCFWGYLELITMKRAHLVKRILNLQNPQAVHVAKQHRSRREVYVDAMDDTMRIKEPRETTPPPPTAGQGQHINLEQVAHVARRERVIPDATWDDVVQCLKAGVSVVDVIEVYPFMLMHIESLILARDAFAAHTRDMELAAHMDADPVEHYERAHEVLSLEESSDEQPPPRRSKRLRLTH